MIFKNTNSWSQFLALAGSLLLHILILLLAFPTLEFKPKMTQMVFLPVTLDVGPDAVPVPKPVVPVVKKVAPVKQAPTAHLGPKVPMPEVISPVMPSVPNLPSKGLEPTKPAPPVGDVASGTGTSVVSGPLPGDRELAEAAGMVKPIYPKEALNNNLQGTVTVEVSIDASGNPVTVRLLKSSGHKVLDDSFIRSIGRYYRFKPRRVMGQDLPSTMKLSYTYSLDN